MRFGTFKSFEFLLQNQDLIRTDVFLTHTRECLGCAYLKADYFLKSGDWRGERVDSFLKRTDVRGKTLFIGHSDISCSKAKIAFARVKAVKQIWGVNTPSIHNFSHSLPLGLTNSTKESPLHELFGNDELIRKANEEQFPDQFTGTIYASFTIDNNQRERKKILDDLDRRRLIFQKPDFSINGRISFLTMLRKCNFVLCPAGNGVDTHRIWETLYMGGIPIIKSHPLLNSLAANLPIFIVKSWGEVNDVTKLEQFWSQTQNSIFEFEKLSASFWLLKACMNRLD